jgi:[ribosomal protein S18]-alanine N-acetyltransferase
VPTTVVRIRPMREEDLSAVVRIERASFGDPWSEASFRSFCAHPQVRALVAVGAPDAAAAAGGAASTPGDVPTTPEVLGYAIAWVVADEGELANFAVDPALRRRGVGRTLLDALLDELDARGVASCHLEVREGNAAAGALYAQRGFRPVGRRAGYYREPTEDALLLRRERGGGAPAD